EHSVLLDVLGERAQLLGGRMPVPTCPRCQATMELNEDPQQYIRLVNTYGAKSLDDAAIPILQRKRLYLPRRVGRPPETTKLVHGDVPLFHLSGTIDRRFRPRRLTAGIEGDVVVDLGEVEGVDDDGAAGWRELIEQLAVARSVTLVDVPEVLLQLICASSLGI